MQFVTLGATGDDALQHIGKIGERLDAVELTALDQRVGNRPMTCSGVTAREQRVLSSDGHRPFILPMSGKSWKSTIHGTRIFDARFLFGG